MAETKEVWEFNNASRDKAFLLQFEGDEADFIKKLEISSYVYNGCPIEDMRRTGLFGMLDALMDLGLTPMEIMNFYIHGHVEPYTDPHRFTDGIIRIVKGMPKEDIKNQYGHFFNDERIAKFANISKNTQMLISFCFDKDDIYEFISDKVDLYDRFAKNYNSIYGKHRCNDYREKKVFPRIDGKLFRVVRFLVCHGYDFPDLESLFNEDIKDIKFKQINGENEFILNKEFARKMSDDLLILVYFLKRNKYDFLNYENLFDPNCNDINLRDINCKKVIFNRAYLENDTVKYIDMIEGFNNQGFEIPNVISLCDKRKSVIDVCTLDSEGRRHVFEVRRDVLLSISREWLKTIRKGCNLGFIFPDSDNLFDMTQKMLKFMDSSGKELSVVRDQFSHMLEIITKCLQSSFKVNLVQLFNTNESMVELFDKDGKKARISRDQIIVMMDLFSLLTDNGYHFNNYDNLFDESQPYIVAYDEQGQEKILRRKQINKIVKVQELSKKNRDELSDSEKDILLMLNNTVIKNKLFEWLPYTAKKWLPSSAVISKIPAEQSHEYFYNNNHERLGILKDEYQARSYEEMEGIVSLGYILGLFDSKESTSEKALEYIIDYFLKKGVTARELHTTYGAIDLKKGYDKKFADFFMQHYAIDNCAFIEPDLGTNMVGELFERFGEVLESRPEKRIKTRTIKKLLTPIDAMAVITKAEIDREMLGDKALDDRYINLVSLLMKFGASKSELRWAISLYEQALALDEEKVIIPNIVDAKADLMKFTSYLKSDPQAFISGRKTNCCSTYGGHAQDRLTHVITDPNWRYVTFTSPNRTFFDGLVWYDEEKKVVCIDNVEGQFSKIDKNDTKSVAMMADTVIRYADGVYHKMKELNIPCSKVNVGNDPGTASWEIFDYANKQGLICEDDNPCDYPERNGITTDAEKQYTITNEKILGLRG